MAGAANPQNVMPNKPQMASQGAAYGTQFYPGPPTPPGALPAGGMSQSALRAGAMNGQPQQLIPGFAMPNASGAGALAQSQYPVPDMEQLAAQMAAAPAPQGAPAQAAYGGATGGGMATMTNALAPTTQPAQPAQPAQPSVFQQAAGAYNTALQGPNIGQFMNPYTQEVIDRTAADINAAQQMSMNQLGAQAAQARAFGGSRHGVAEAQTNAGFTKQLADTSANLRQQGFNTALGAAQQQQQMLSNLAQQGFDFGRNLNQQRMEQGNVQRTTMQDLINAARNQFSGFTGAPAQSLQLPMQALGAANMGQQTQNQTRNLGLFDYLTLGATALAGLR